MKVKRIFKATSNISTNAYVIINISRKWTVKKDSSTKTISVNQACLLTLTATAQFYEMFVITYFMKMLILATGCSFGALRHHWVALLLGLRLLLEHCNTTLHTNVCLSAQVLTENTLVQQKMTKNLIKVLELRCTGPGLQMS